MTDITAEAQFDNFFALFEQPVQFEVNQESLDQHLRLLQKRYHPDNVTKNLPILRKRNSSLSRPQR